MYYILLLSPNDLKIPWTPDISQNKLVYNTAKENSGKRACANFSY